MIDHVWQRLDQGARLALPFTAALLCALLGVIAWPLPWLGTVAPPLALIAVYYWTVQRPDLFGPGMAFAIGLLNDIVNYLPMGMSALIFVVAHQVILQYRRFLTGHAFFMLWTGFTLTLVAVMVAEWALICLIRWQWNPVLPVLLQILLAVCFFPLPCWLLIRLQRLIPTPA